MFGTIFRRRVIATGLHNRKVEFTAGEFKMKRTNTRLKTILFFAVLILFGSFALESRAETYTVDTTADNPDLTACTAAVNDCSLRGAITKTNSTTADDTINFAISANDSGCASGGVCTITLTNDKLTVNVVSTAGKLTITNSTGANKLLISGNNASQVFFINRITASDYGNLTLDGVTITRGNGTPSGIGGGINNAGILTIMNSIITGNSAAGFLGGGIGNNFSLTIINSTISNNTAANGGGIWSRYDADLIIMNSTISGNVAEGNGGGIDFETGQDNVSNGSFDIRNSTISGNTARTGGGILATKPYFFGPKPILVSVTITDNSSSANSAGGARFVNAFNDTDGEVILKNTIIAGNHNADVPDAKGILEANSDYNLIGDGTGLTNNSTGTGNQIGTAANPINPLLRLLASNGGTTMTHELLPNSPAIDKGDSFGLTTDQRGFSRPVDILSIANASDGADIGAFELQNAPTAAEISIGGRVLTTNGRGLMNAQVSLIETNKTIRYARTTAFGYFRFSEIEAGSTVIISVNSKRYVFSPQVISAMEDLTDLNFFPESEVSPKSKLTSKF